MLDGLKKLLDLKRIDAELNALEAEGAGLPARREQIARARAESDERLAGAKSAAEGAELEQRRLEAEIRDREELRARLEGQSAQVKSNEAYRALLHEIEQANSAISERETRVLELMDEIDEARTLLAATEEDRRTSHARLDAEGRSLDVREEQLLKELARVRAARSETCAAIDHELLAHYERVASRRQPAVALVSGELCLGCQVRLPPQQYIELLSGDRIVTCGSCTRILVHERFGG